jgi:hypothetical protein
MYAFFKESAKVVFIGQLAKGKLTRDGKKEVINRFYSRLFHKRV